MKLYHVLSIREMEDMLRKAKANAKEHRKRVIATGHKPSAYKNWCSVVYFERVEDERLRNETGAWQLRVDMIHN